jgi:hypothetical protein
VLRFWKAGLFENSGVLQKSGRIGRIEIELQSKKRQKILTRKTKVAKPVF